MSSKCHTIARSGFSTFQGILSGCHHCPYAPEAQAVVTLNRRYRSDLQWMCIECKSPYLTFSKVFCQGATIASHASEARAIVTFLM